MVGPSSNLHPVVARRLGHLVRHLWRAERHPRAASPPRRPACGRAQQLPAAALDCGAPRPLRPSGGGGADRGVRERYRSPSEPEEGTEEQPGAVEALRPPGLHAGSYKGAARKSRRAPRRRASCCTYKRPVMPCADALHKTFTRPLLLPTSCASCASVAPSSGPGIDPILHVHAHTCISRRRSVYRKKKSI